MGHYVYKYVLGDEIIYIGKNDTDLVSKINSHDSNIGNRNEDVYSDFVNSKVYYIEVANSIMSDVVESEMIRRYKPRYNIAKMSDWDGLPFEEPEWKEYTGERVFIDEARVKRRSNNKIVVSSIGEKRELLDITKLRTMTRLSQSKFAERYHLSINTLKKWEQGQRPIPEWYLWVLNELFKYEDYFYDNVHD